MPNHYINLIVNRCECHNGTSADFTLTSKIEKNSEIVINRCWKLLWMLRLSFHVLHHQKLETVMPKYVLESEKFLRLPSHLFLKNSNTLQNTRLYTDCPRLLFIIMSQEERNFYENLAEYRLRHIMSLSKARVSED